MAAGASIPGSLRKEVGAVCPSPRARSGTAPFRIDKAPGIESPSHPAAPLRQSNAGGAGPPAVPASDQPTAISSPRPWLRLLVTRSMRSAAELSAAAIAACVAFERSAVTAPASCIPAS